MTAYQISLLKDPNSNSHVSLVKTITDRIEPALNADGAVVFGVFAGLFGLATNEVYLVTNCERDEAPDLASILADSAITLVAAREMAPTVRPTDHSPRTREGIYVFRWFEVAHRDVDQIVDLSERAWLSFEPGFDTEVQGLFADSSAHREQTEHGQMLLLTWYQDLNAWEDSRTPSVEARELFRERHELMFEAKPFCTRLIIR